MGWGRKTNERFCFCHFNQQGRPKRARLFCKAREPHRLSRFSLLRKPYKEFFCSLSWTLSSRRKLPSPADFLLCAYSVIAGGPLLATAPQRRGSNPPPPPSSGPQECEQNMLRLCGDLRKPPTGQQDTVCSLVVLLQVEVVRLYCGIQYVVLFREFY